MLDPSKACGSDVGAVLGRVWQILRRCGAWLLAEPWRRPEDARLAAELRHGLVDLGPSFVRLGRRWCFFASKNSCEGWFSGVMMCHVSKT